MSDTTSLENTLSTEASAPRVEESADAIQLSSAEGNVGQPADDARRSKDGAAGNSNGAEEDAASEAETLIDSPVKKRKDATGGTVDKAEKPLKSRIGSLPVPGEDDDESDAPGSPVESTETGVAHTALHNGAQDEAMEIDNESDKEDGNSSGGSLSSARSTASNVSSRESSRSRALSERPQLAGNRMQSPNPRKRKHRASSVSLLDKRQSLEPPKRRLRGLHSEDHVGKAAKSPSPQARAHRRAVSTQSALLDGTTENSSHRHRRGPAQIMMHDSKAGKSTWEESDASSETTSHGHNDHRRPQRGVGRSTSTPGRPPGREHKRHVNKYGFTRLAEACEAGDLALVKEWRQKDPDQLELAEFASNTPLQIAALNGNEEVVSYLIGEGCKIDCANVDKDTPLIDAAENGHLGVVKILLEAGVDPLRQNLKGQQAMDVVGEDTEDADQIRVELRRAIENWTSDDAKARREADEFERHKDGSKNKNIHFMARSYENLIKLVTNNDRNGVKEFLDARVPVDNTVIAVAAKTGDLYLVNMLLAEMTDKKAYQKAEKPMLAVLGTSHFEMVKALTELDQFNPLYNSRAGKTWPELAEERNGPHWVEEKELLQRLYRQHSSGKLRRSSSPVTGRESSKRRGLHASVNDDSDDNGSAPKRKNGRRLMSRRDMRAASGKPRSESDSEESNSDADVPPYIPRRASEHEVLSMKPPESPARRRASEAATFRAKNFSMQSGESSPQFRRRTSSLRSVAERPLPSVAEERVEENKLSDEQASTEDRKSQVNFVLAQIQRFDAKAKEERAAEEEARRKQQEVTEAKEVEEERQRNEQLRVKREEEARAYELNRRLEQDRQQQEIERRQKARERMEAEVVEALPPSLSHVLQHNSSLDLQNEGKLAHIVKHFMPLQLLGSTSSRFPTAHAGEDDYWVLNAQAAALLGRPGLEILLPATGDGLDKTFSAPWATLSTFSRSEQQTVDTILADLAAAPPRCDSVLGDPDDMDHDDVDAMADEMSFEDELRRIAESCNAAREHLHKLYDGPVKLCGVKLVDVLRHLDSSLQDTSLQIQMPCVASEEKKDEDSDLVVRLARLWKDTGPLFRVIEGGKMLAGPEAVGDVVVVQDVVLVHEK